MSSFDLPLPDGLGVLLGVGQRALERVAQLRSNIATRTTILPHTIAPGEPIEDHEYWVGIIREIRGTIFSEDSNEVRRASS